MIANYALIEQTLVSALGPLRAIAVAYLDAPPEGVVKFTGTRPSGCSFWSFARENDGFYTVPSDHYNCPIGSYTHAIDLPPERSAELGQTLSLMADLGYVRMEEVPAIPRLPKAPAFIYYAPLAATVVDPHVVIIAGRPGPLMRLHEASARAGATAYLPLLGRPTCMALPAAMVHGSVMSTGCVGNRVYTGLGDDELYLMIPGDRLEEVIAQVTPIMAANATIEQYHRARKETLTA